MAHKTADGKRQFTNKSQARNYDRKNVSTGAKEAPAPEGDLQDEASDGVYGHESDDMGGGQDGAALAQEHGPAHKVTIQHDEATGMHHVMVDHPDGHAHQTQHGDAASAHQFGMDCAGA